MEASIKAKLDLEEEIQVLRDEGGKARERWPVYSKWEVELGGKLDQKNM